MLLIFGVTESSNRQSDVQLFDQSFKLAVDKPEDPQLSGTFFVVGASELNQAERALKRRLAERTARLRSSWKQANPGKK